MSIQAIVYLASIIDQVRVTLAALTVSISAGNAIWVIRRSAAFEYNVAPRPFLWKLHLPIWVFAALLGFVLSAIPSGDNLYKIAGVTEQQKTAIDAAGRIVK